MVSRHAEMTMRPVKRRRVTPPPSEGGDEASKTGIQKAFFKNAASWDLEQDYESRPRKGKKKEKESTRLPIKTADGQIQQAQVEADTASVVSNKDWLDGGSESGAQSEGEAEPVAPAVPKVSEREQILKAKEELAKIASALAEDPEENPGAFKALAQIGDSKLPAVQKLALATQMTVYRDAIPGYRIRPAADGPAEKLSKEVRRVRLYEQSLVSGYQAYIKELATLAKSKQPGSGAGLSSIAITCACTLLTTVPHFNFRTDLIKILVQKLSTRKADESFRKCLRALETLFKDDEEGKPAMEAVSVLSRMMKARNFRVDESVLNLFLHLRLLSEFSGKASQDKVDRPAEERKPKAKREFRTKRERKLLKEQKAVEKDMAHADAIVSHEERDKVQSETLQLVFATYFRILKLRLPHLMGAVLEGLSKYAHLINQDFFGDLLEALKDLIRDTEAGGGEPGDEDADGGVEDDDLGTRNTSRESLLCVVTAFALLAGQDAHNSRNALHLDLSFFTTHLFRSLSALSTNPDLELGARSLHLPDPDSPEASANRSNKVNSQTTTVLLVRCLTAVLLPPWNIRSVPPLRLAAFSKQIMTASLHMPEKSCQAALALLHDVSHTHGNKIAALWSTDERKGDGKYNPLSDTVEGSNPFATTVWEGELLRRHFCPKVREGAKLLEKNVSI
ncbi:hypothetical protein RB596_001329 [Gaeumannomyces avenae]